MIDNLIFSLNATMPIFLLMVVGYVLRELGWLKEPVTSVINKLVFKVFLPALIIMDMIKQDFAAIWDGQFVLFCLGATVTSILIAILLSFTNKNKCERGEMIQAIYRSGVATLGIAYMTNIYNSSATMALMIISIVPVYNIVAVLVLTLTAPGENASNGEAAKGQQDASSQLKRSIKNTLTNPIIIGILIGLIWALGKLPQPAILVKTITYLGNVASPLALIGLGASFHLTDVREKLKPVSLVVFGKLILFCALFVPLAVWFGFRTEKLVAILIMLGSATTSSCFVMAKSMGHEGKITSCAILLTTLLSSFTISVGLFILRTLGYI